MKGIREEVGDSYVWVGVDETTDSTGRYVAALVVGTLFKEKAGKCYLVSVEELDKTNSTTIAQFFSKVLQQLWSETHHDRTACSSSSATPRPT